MSQYFPTTTTWLEEAVQGGGKVLVIIIHLLSSDHCAHVCHPGAGLPGQVQGDGPGGGPQDGEGEEGCET